MAKWVRAPGKAPVLEACRTMPAEENIRDLFEKSAITVDSSSLVGSVTVLDRQALEAAIRNAAAAGGEPTPDVSLVEPYLDYDPSDGFAVLDEIDAVISLLETALNEEPEAEGHWEMMTRIAEMRADHAVIKDDLTKAGAAIKELSADIRSGAADTLRFLALVNAVTTASGKTDEANLLKKAADFIKNILRIE
jgi:hypothetical protein